MDPEHNGEILPKTVLTVDELKERREIRQIGGARELIFTDLQSDEYVARSTEPLGEDLQRIGAEVRKDHYNETEPIEIEGSEVIAAREEPKDSEDSCTCYFRHDKEKDIWVLIPDADRMEGCQDPSYQGEIDGEKYLSVVNTRWDWERGEYAYWSELFKINKNLKDNELVAKSPELCKGLHIAKNTVLGGIDGVIRLQGEEYGRGKICCFHTESIEEVPEIISDPKNKTEVLETFDPNEWGGVNDLHVLEDGRIGIVGHIARLQKDAAGIETDGKEYCVTAAVFDPRTKQMSDLEIIMTLDDLKDENGNLIKDQFDPKNANLENVLYPTNSVLNDDKLTIYVGVKDARPFAFTVEKPKSWA